MDIYMDPAKTALTIIGHGRILFDKYFLERAWYFFKVDLYFQKIDWYLLKMNEYFHEPGKKCSGNNLTLFSLKLPNIFLEEINISLELIDIAIMPSSQIIIIISTKKIIPWWLSSYLCDIVWSPGFTASHITSSSQDKN